MSGDLRELDSLARRERGLAGSAILLAVIAIVAGSVYWASQAEIEKVTRGEGRLVPATRTQVIQSLEGGLITEILVSEGERVREGQRLFVIDDTQFQSALGETTARRAALIATAARLEAEISGAAPEFDSDILEAYPELVNREIEVLNARRREQDATLSVIDDQVRQKQAEIDELQEKITQLIRSVELTQEEIDLVAPMVDLGVQPKVALLRLERELNESSGQLASTREAYRRAVAALSEVRQRYIEQQAIFQTRAREELAETEADLNSVTQTLVGDEDKVARSVLLAPRAGTIKELRVGTVGQVVGPGDPIAEIVPLDETLLVETKIRPSDIAFLRPDLEARVRITAYDFAVYGSLKAVVETIAPDTVEEEDGQQFYKVLVRTEDVLRDKQGEPLAIIPGMIATVDIVVGGQTVLDYFMKPILRAQQSALREP